MVSHFRRNPERIHVGRLVRAFLVVAALLCVPFLDVSYAQQSNPIPPEIQNLKMGVSKEAVIEKIKSLGTFTTEPVKKEKDRTMLVWLRPNTPYYKDIEFQFTEKDRLYLIRFTLNDKARSDYHSLKRTVFKDYEFSWERPQKLRLPDREMLLYGPEKGMELFFIEFTDRKTHEKSFELFDRSISSTDRAEPISLATKKPQEGAADTQKTEEQPGAKSPEGEKAESVKQPASPADAAKPAKDEKTEGTKQPASSVEPPKTTKEDKAESVKQADPGPAGQKQSTDAKEEAPEKPVTDKKPMDK